MDSMSEWRFGALTLICLAACVVAFSVLVGQPASACAAALQVPCGYARIEGKVSAGDTGLGLANASVLVASTSVANFASFATTKVDGSYVIDIPVARVGNNFNLQASPGFSNPRYLLSPEVVAVEIMSGTVTTRNFTLEVGASIVGQVTSAKTSQPLTQTQVTALRFDEVSGRYNRESNFVSLDATGTFTMPGLQSGSYVVHYQPLDNNIFHMSLYSEGAYRLEDAEPFTLTAPVVVQKDVMISIGANVEGVIRRGDNNMPVAGAQVYLWNQQDSELLFSQLTFFARSDESGRYLIAGVPPGQYHMRAIPDSISDFPENRDLLGAFYGDTRNIADADVVIVAAANLDNPANPVSASDIHLPVGATIRGIVRDAVSDAPLAGVSVNVSRTINSDLVTPGSLIVTDASGVYTVTGLEAGMAQVFFSGSAEYLPQAFNGIDLAQHQTGGDFIELELGKTTMGINGALNKASHLSGRVTDPEANPIMNVFVRLEQVQDPSIFYETSTNANGDYARLIAPGDYYVRFSRNVICGCYNREYYSTGDAPTAVMVGAVTQVTGINAVLECGVAPPLEEEHDTLFMPKLARP